MEHHQSILAQNLPLWTSSVARLDPAGQDAFWRDIQTSEGYSDVSVAYFRSCVNSSLQSPCFSRVPYWYASPHVRLLDLAGTPAFPLIQTFDSMERLHGRATLNSPNFVAGVASDPNLDWRQKALLVRGAAHLGDCTPRCNCFIRCAFGWSLLIMIATLITYASLWIISANERDEDGFIIIVLCILLPLMIFGLLWLIPTAICLCKDAAWKRRTREIEAMDPAAFASITI
jgi:hypothetical protein